MPENQSNRLSQEEYERVEPDRLMSDKEFDRIHMLEPADFDRLPRDVHLRYAATYKWHAGRRQSLDSLEGITIGGKSVEDVLREVRKKQLESKGATMTGQEDTDAQEAKHGEKMIWLKVGFWTDKIADEPGKIIPRHAWTSGVVRMLRNESHGVEPGQPIPFGSLLELAAEIENLLIRDGITLHPAKKMQKYLEGK